MRDRSAEAQQRRSLRRKPRDEYPGSDPLAFCPGKARQRYSLSAERAKQGHYRDAVKLKCLDCCGWDYKEAKGCGIVTCALWPVSRRIFGR